MKVRYKPTFEYGRNLAKYLLVGSVVFVLAALMLVPGGSVAQAILIALSFVLMAALVFVIVKYCRCPYCGRVIAAGVLRTTVCPGCRRSLSTGRKVKKSELK